MASHSLQAVIPTEGDFSLDASRVPFLAFVADETSETAIRAGLAPVIDDVRIRRGTVKTATKVLATEPTPHRLLVDISGIDDPIRALDELANVCTPDVKLFVIGERTDMVFYRLLTRELGAEEYLFKPLSRDAVITLLGPLIDSRQEERSPKRGCRIVAVCGARGGVGATTAAIGIASEVAAIKGHVALLDMHLRGGSAALALGAKAGAGLRIALEEPERLDALFLDRVAMSVGERLHLIAAEESFSAFPRPTPEGVEKLLELMQDRFTHVVVDLPNPPAEAEALVLRAARHVVIVMGPDVAGIRDANATQQLVADLAPSAQICTILNRSDRAGALKAAIVEGGLHRPIDISIGDMSRQLSRSANLGRPALIRESGLVTALAPLLQELTGVASAQPAKRGLSALWKFR
jgi:pilus assembly protein CpaE